MGIEAFSYVEALRGNIGLWERCLQAVLLKTAVFQNFLTYQRTLIRELRVKKSHSIFSFVDKAGNGQYVELLCAISRISDRRKCRHCLGNAGWQVRF